MDVKKKEEVVEEQRSVEVKPAPVTVDTDAVRKEAAEAERVRASEIMKTCRKSGMEEGFALRMIEEGKSIDQVRALVIDAIADREEKEAPETRNQVSAQAGKDASEKFLEGASDWLIQRAGVGRVYENHTKKTLNAGEFRGLSMVDLARESLTRAGVNVRGMDKVTMVGKALTLRSITQSASDFPVLLENTLHKVLLAAYGTTPDTWSRFCAVGSVSDFRAHNRYRMGSFSKLDKVLESGEFKSKGIPDGEKESIQAGTYGNIINLSRQAIVNDDMGAFSRLATMLGRAARLSVEADVYALLASNPTLGDGVALFHADHGNLGTAAAPSVDSFEEVRVKMGSQKDPEGNEILDLRPSIWVGPLGLGGDAKVINDAQYDPTTANKLQKPNKVRGLFADIVDTARLSGSAWYGFADPMVAPTFEVVFLDGQQAPYLENQEGFRVDGVEWKVRLDYGVGAVDFRGAVKNAGV